MYESRFSVSSDGKTLTAWEFMNPVAVNASEYKIIEGANGTWTQNTDKTLTFRANGDFSAFSEVKVDGNTVSAENYTAVSGSTVITLKKEYLNTLSEGKHTLTVVYNDGNCSTEFEIKNKSPETGDSNNYFMWLVLVFVCVCAAGGTLYFVKKKNTVKQAE